MTKTKQTALRFTDETFEQAQELARLWSPVKPLSLADTVAECIKRAYEQEAKKGRTARR